MLPLLAMPDDKIPPDMRHYGDFFLTEDEDSAYAKLEAWVFDKTNTDQETARRIGVARELIVRGGYVSARYRDHERFVEPLIARINAEEGDNWLALREAAEILDDSFLDHHGILAEGKFVRGQETGGAMRYSEDRDRFHAIAIYQRAIALCERSIEAGNAKPADLAALYLDLADCLDDRVAPEADFLTDLEKEPALATKKRKLWNRVPNDTLVDGRSPAIGTDGTIQLPAAAASLKDAPSDLARQRWLIEEAAARISPAYRAPAQLKLAELWRDWLGVEQLVAAGYFYIEGTESELDPDAPGEFELHTLKSDQTILITPDGPKRLTIPPGFRFIEILENLIADPKTPQEERIDAYYQLFEILSNRRQFDRVEQLALELKKRPTEGKSAHRYADEFLSEFKPDGRFLSTGPSVSGRGIEVEFLSRNVDQLYLELWHLDVEKAVAGDASLNKLLNGHSYTYDYGYMGEQERDELLPYYKRIKQWTTRVEKLPRHLQSLARIPIAPLDTGHYLLVSRGYGQTLGVSLNVEATMLVGTRIDAETANYLLLDSKTGEPVTDAEIIPIRYSSEGSYFPDYLGAFTTDDSFGTMLVRRPGHPPELKLSDDATMDDGDPTAHLGIETFFVTNQPLYRPGQTVNFSCWIRQPGNRWFDPKTAYPDTKIRIKVEDPTGSVISTGTYPLDEFGAFSGSFRLDPDIALGSCEITLESMGPLSNPDKYTRDPFAPESWNYLDGWRIEVGEFRKPDFRLEVEAADTPTIGSVEVIVSANYNSGEPMIGEEVMGELTAYPIHTVPFPKSDFERDYDVGYDWPLPESPWMPDWQTWGIRHSLLGEEDFTSNTSSIIREITATTGEDGKARLVFPDRLPRIGQFSYECEVRAAVKESSGRSMVGGLTFIESGRSKSLFIRPGKGFYRAGEGITLTLNAMDAQREPVPATGSLRVDRLSYAAEDRTPTYGKILERSVSFGGEGQATVSFTPPEPGQYLCMFTSGDARRGIVLNVLADGYDARDLRFNPIQLTPDRSVCAQGEKIEVVIHCDKPDALVWLFQIMPDGRRQTPRMIQMRGKVAVVEIVAPLNGTPNFQLLAMTAGNGSVDQARCQISLPARESILAVELTSAPEKPEPGTPVSLALSVRDHLGQPTRASFAITAFDRSLGDLADPLPKTRVLLPNLFDPFWGGNPLPVANRDRYRDEDAFQQLWEPGCFSDRGGLIGKIVRKKESRLSKVSDELLIAYEPPELPNSVGSTGGSAGPFGGSFPMTPATPSYQRPTATRIDLAVDAADSLVKTAARKNFADYAHWGAAVTTDEQGHAKISFPLPDNLTAWKTQAWAFGQANRFGDAELEITASKPLQIRPVLPRSAVHGDKLEIAATIQNLSDRAAEFHLLLEVSGLETSLPSGKGDAKSVTIPAGGEGFVTWPVELLAAGTANFHFVARSTDGSLTDGTKLPLIVAPRTTPVVAVASETMNGNETVEKMDLDLSGMPAEATLRLRLSSQAAIDAFGAIPELASYPFGCVEQTLNRFLPLLIASKTVESLDSDWDAMMKQITVADDSRGWIRGRPLLHVVSAREPLTSEKTDILVRAGLKRLHDMANEDDSWGWFKGGEPSPYLTALVIRASLVAKRLGYQFEEGGKPVERISTSWLKSHAGKRAVELRVAEPEIEPEDAFIAYVLSLSEEKEHAALQGILLEHIDKLALSARIFLALSLDPHEQADALAKLLPAIHKEMLLPDDTSTDYRRWWQDPTETRAWYLMLLTHLDPEDSRIPEEVERLLAMRTNGLVWKSTRDTALCVEAIAGTLSPFDLGSGSMREISLGIEIAGKPFEAKLKAGNFWIQEMNVPITRGQLVDGRLRFAIRRQGTTKSIVRASASVRYDTDAAEHITAASSGLEIQRNYYLIRKGEHPLLLEKGAEINPGDLIEVEIKVSSPQPREFVHISDPIPAGLEPLHQLSGQENGAYRETRLGESHLFIASLNRWNDTFRYRCHAVTPGASHALPARAECMYAPAVFGSTPSALLTVRSAR